MKIRLRKGNYFAVKKNFFQKFLNSKMSLKINFRIITKKYAAYQVIRISKKIDFKSVWAHESNSKAWELKIISLLLNFDFYLFDNMLHIKNGYFVISKKTKTV